MIPGLVVFLVVMAVFFILLFKGKGRS